MQPGEEVLATLQRLKSEFSTRFSVSRIGIFGSVARGEQTEASDIDILVELSRPVGFFTFVELEEYLSLCLGAPVDLVTPDALKPLIREQVTADMTQGEFLADTRTQDAVTRNLELLGEAVKNLPEPFTKQYASSPLTRPAGPPHASLSRSTIVFCR